MRSYAMEMKPLFEKIRVAKCLELGELEVLAAALDELDARRQMDARDVRWAQDMAKYVEERRGKRRGIYLVIASREECFMGVIVGLCMVAYGVYMLAHFFAAPANEAAGVFFGAILVTGLWVIRSCRRARKVVGIYEQERAKYAADRIALCQHLPPEFQRRYRFCPNCLNSD